MYRPVDAAMARLTAWPSEQDMPPWPHLPDPRGASAPAEQQAAESSRAWLDAVMTIPPFGDAVEQASPALAHRVAAIRSGVHVAAPDEYRATLAIMRYLLRATGRATPFGLFAGIASALLDDRATARVGTRHRSVGAVDSAWLHDILDRLESDPDVRHRLHVVRNNLLIERGGELLLTHRPACQSGTGPTRVQVKATPPIRAILRIASSPIAVTDVADALAGEFPGVPAHAADRLVAGLVTRQLLLTSLRPPMTAVNPVAHLLDELATIGAIALPGVTNTVAGLRSAADTHKRRPAARGFAHATAQPDVRLAVDLRMDATITVPPTVTDEVARAAAALVRLAVRPDLGTGWASWHEAFLERYGPHALVDLRAAVDTDTGLGFPPGFLSAPPPTAPAMTSRDRALLTLAQNAALRGDQEIVLDDAAIDALTVIDANAPIQPSTEVTVRIHATSTRHIDAGDFSLSITGISRGAGTMTGRFLRLLDPPDQARIERAYAGLPTVTDTAIRAQISAPPLYSATENVARAPRALPYVLPLGEHHVVSPDDPDSEKTIELDDLAVTADATRIMLISRSRRRPVEPTALDATEPVRHLHPLTRFLLEAPRALAVPCTVFDWGAASYLPFLPAVRYGRTLLYPACWQLPAADLPGASADQSAWDETFAVWRRERRLPAHVYAGNGDQRLGLDLNVPAHRAVLRSLASPGSTVMLRAASGDTSGWTDGRAHEIVIPVASTQPPAPAPRLPHRPTVTGRCHGYPPGRAGRFYLKIYSHPDRHHTIVTRYLPQLIAGLDPDTVWWFLRYHDASNRPGHHLRLRLRTPERASHTAGELLSDWADQLRNAGLAGRIQWDTYFPEEGRFGTGPAMPAAEEFFAADSAAVVAQLAASVQGCELRAITAASMFDLTSGALGGPDAAAAWLIRHARTTASAPARPLYRQAVSLTTNLARTYARPPSETGHIEDGLRASWNDRRTRLSTYLEHLGKPCGRTADELLPDLLHLHHVRVAGLDPDGERICLHLARAAALSWTARQKDHR